MSSILQTMAFNPFHLFRGNPKVQQLLAAKAPLDTLLLQDPFQYQFKKPDNEPISTYMDYEKYAQLISYITTINQQLISDSNRCYKFPFIAAEILSSNNEEIYKALLQRTGFVEETIEEVVQVQKEIDSDSSERSFRSSSSINSNSSHSSREIRQYKEFSINNKENFQLENEEGVDQTQNTCAEDKEISAEDFPEAKFKKIVVVKEIVKKTVRKYKEPLVFKLLDYFENNQIIHILDGYVCKVIESVINNKFQIFMGVVAEYQRYSRFVSILKHLESVSVQELLINFIEKLLKDRQSNEKICEILLSKLQISSFLSQDQEDNQNFDHHRLNLYSTIIHKLLSQAKSKIQQHLKKQNSTQKKEGQPQKLQVDLKLELEGLQMFIKKEIIETTISNIDTILQSIQKYDIHALSYSIKILKSVLAALKLLKKWQSQHYVSKQTISLIKQITINWQQGFEKIIEIVMNAISLSITLTEKKIKQKNALPLSIKSQLLQIICILVEQNIYFCKKTLIDNSQYGCLCKLFSLHPNSSILHNLVLRLWLTYLSDPSLTPFISKFLSNLAITSFLYEQAKGMVEDKYEKKVKQTRAYKSHLIALAKQISTLQSQQCPELILYRQSDQWQFIRQYFLGDEEDLRKKELGGHIKLVLKKPIILKSKQESLEYFKHFLSNEKFNIFDEFQNYQPDNSDSEDERENKKQSSNSNSTFISDSKQVQDEALNNENNSKYFEQDYIL